MTDYLTQTEFAEKIGVSQARIALLVKQGRLNDAIKVVGKRKFIHLEKGKQILSRNMDQLNDSKIISKLSGEKAENKEIKIEERKKVIDVPASPLKLNYHTARTLNEQYKAVLKKLEYEVASKKLIPADQIKNIWIRHIQTAKTKMLGIKSKCAPLVMTYLSDPNDRENLLDSIDSCVRDILNELSESEL